MAYVCYALARDAVTGSRTVALADLADPSLMSPRYFMVIQTAMVIRGYGLNAANKLRMDNGKSLR